MSDAEWQPVAPGSLPAVEQACEIAFVGEDFSRVHPTTGVTLHRYIALYGPPTEFRWRPTADRV